MRGGNRATKAAFIACLMMKTAGMDVTEMAYFRD
jgi:hypothetical protein